MRVVQLAYNATIATVAKERVMRTAADVPTTRVTPMTPMVPYGMELVMDLHDCNHTLFTREAITTYIMELCRRIDMEREALHFWDYEKWPHLKEEAPPHLKGITAVQFIKTSNITIHALDDLRRVYINIFSCREFKVADAVEYTTEFFGASWCGQRSFERA